MTDENTGGDAGDNAGDEGGEGGDAGHSNDQGDNQGGAGGESVRDPEAVLAKNKELTGELSAAKTKLAEFETAAEERRKAALSENDKAVEAAEQTGYDKAAAEFGTQLLDERIYARAAGVLADPSDAVSLLDKTDLDMNDAKALDKAIAALVKAKPHLKATQRRTGINQGPQGEPAPTGDANDWLRGVLGG